MTNGDRIRQMSDEELFDEYLQRIDCSQCDFWRKCDDRQESSAVGWTADQSCGGRKWQEIKSRLRWNMTM